VVALDFATIIGGAIITEIAFGWNGMGPSSCIRG